MKDNVSFKFESSYWQKNFFSKTPVSLFVFVSLFIATYFLLKLIIESIESNPGGYYGEICGIKKTVQGTFHQEYTRFGETARIKCTSNAYFAIIFSAIKKVSLWKSIDVHYIIDKGDMFFKSLDINQPLAVDELPYVVDIEGYNTHTYFFTT